MKKSRISLSTPAPRQFPCGRPISPKLASPSHVTSSLKAWQKQLDEYLVSNDLNQSDSRNKIMEVVLKEPSHFNIGELVSKIRQSYPHIGAATVYRTIPILLEAGIMRETLVDEGGQKVYEAGKEEHHDHIVCLDCNEIFEFHEEVIEVAQDRAAQKMDFEPIRHRHVIYAKCRFKAKRSNSK